MFSFKKTKEIYHSPRIRVSEVDLESNCLLSGSEPLLNIQADLFDMKGASSSDATLGRGTDPTYLEY